MALFKIKRGNSSNLPVTLTDGWAYFCTDTGEFFIDYSDVNGVLHRKQINSGEANKLAGYDITTVLNDSNTQIPTSGSVKKYIDENIDINIDAVLYDTDQDLDDAQQLQARKNIDAAKKSIVEVSDTVPTDPETTIWINTSEESGNGVAGSGGGVSSWNDLTDKPFYEESGLVEVVPETHIDGNALEDGIIHWLEDNIALEEGKTYEITYDGKKYTSVCKKDLFANMDLLYIGNFGLAGGEDTGEPVAIGKLLWNGASAAFVSEPIDHTLSVSCVDVVIKTLDPKFLPEALQFGYEKQFTGPFTIDSRGIVIDELPTDSSGKFYKFSDFVPTTDELMSASVTFQGQTLPINTLGELFTSGSGEVYGVVPLVVVTEAAVGFVEAIIPDFGISTFPEAGMYTISEFFGASITFPSVTYTDYVKLDNRCLDLEWLPTATMLWEEFLPNTTEFTNADLMNHDWSKAFVAEKFRVHITTSVTTSTYECAQVSVYGIANAIGNMSLLSNNQAQNTGEPFLILFGYMSDGFTVNTTFTDDDIQSIAIDVYVKSYNKIPQEFLPSAEESGSIIELTGESMDADYAALAKLKNQLDRNGGAVCLYKRGKYNVLGVSFDEGGSVLLSHALRVMYGSTRNFEILKLVYEQHAGEAVLLPVMDDYALYLTSSSEADEMGYLHKKRFKITVDDNGTLSATEVTS